MILETREVSCSAEEWWHLLQIRDIKGSFFM